MQLATEKKYHTNTQIQPKCHLPIQDDHRGVLVCLDPHTDDELLKSLQHVLAIPNASFRKDQLEASWFHRYTCSFVEYFASTHTQIVTIGTTELRVISVEACFPGYSKCVEVVVGIPSSSSKSQMAARQAQALLKFISVAQRQRRRHLLSARHSTAPRHSPVPVFLRSTTIRPVLLFTLTLRIARTISMAAPSVVMDSPSISFN